MKLVVSLLAEQENVTVLVLLCLMTHLHGDVATGPKFTFNTVTMAAEV